MVPVQERQRPAHLDMSALHLPIQARQVADGISASSPACKLVVGSPLSASTTGPSSFGRQPSGSSVSIGRTSSFASCIDTPTSMSIQHMRSAGTPVSSTTPHTFKSTYSRLTPAPGYTPLARMTVTTPTVFNVVAASPQTVNPDGKPSVLSTPIVGASPKAGMHQLGCSTSSVQVTSSASVPGTPMSILRTHGPVAGYSYPPGMGFTPAARALGIVRTTSFGMSVASEPPVETKSAEPEVGSDVVHAFEPTISKETLLMYREGQNGLLGSKLSAEEVGFVLPAPGWLCAVDVEAEKEASKGDIMRQPDRPKSCELQEGQEYSRNKKWSKDHDKRNWSQQGQAGKWHQNDWSWSDWSGGQQWEKGKDKDETVEWSCSAGWKGRDQ
eukprot:TRINITY_DN19264_c1_g1_i2.p1 TRINITY_DN19264_c1_g1~~TRINITY_DN19264_c1_g1_i2.p1  ORF type:complete len:384 (+),score=30.36 TRINITY_DN19264_c1_g1_i2:60-1211(+)